VSGYDSHSPTPIVDSYGYGFFNDFKGNFKFNLQKENVKNVWTDVIGITL
jgi:hypothetical protein